MWLQQCVWIQRSPASLICLSISLPLKWRSSENRKPGASINLCYYTGSFQGNQKVKTYNLSDTNCFCAKCYIPDSVGKIDSADGSQLGLIAWMDVMGGPIVDLRIKTDLIEKVRTGAGMIFFILERVQKHLKGYGTQPESKWRTLSRNMPSQEWPGCQHFPMGKV